MTKKIFGSTAILCCLMSFAFSQNVVINEICASNYICATDNDGKHGDWIEIYNPNASPVNLAGRYLTDDFTNLIKFQIPSTNPAVTTVPAFGNILFWIDEDEDAGANHVDFKLNGGGEQIALVASNGTTIIDSITFDKQLYDISYGRTTDGSPNWSYFATPTPWAPNAGGGLIGISGKADADHYAGFYPNPIQVAYTYVQDTTAAIYYTLNGNDPNPTTGILYTGPIQVDTNAVIRTRVFRTNYVPGEITTKSFFINRTHNLPILSIVTDSSNLWDENTGIYCWGVDDYSHVYPYSGANFREDWKRPGHIELFETNDAEVVSQNMNISISGNTSRAFPQKSMNFEAKDALGKGNIPCQLFPQLQIVEYKSFKIRNGGTDWSSTAIRDAVNHNLTEKVVDMEYMANRRVIVYINGQYWGWMNMTEKIDEDFLNEHYPVIDKDEVDLVYNNSKAIKGDSINYGQMLNYIANNPMSVPANYNYIKTQIDITNYINYQESRIYYATTDWPSNNIKYWRPRDLSMKWRWIQWDTDRSTLLTLNPNHPCNFTHNTVAWAISNPVVPAWGRFLLQNLLLSPEFKKNFIVQFANHMNFTYCPTRVDSVLNAFRSEIAPDMPKHIARWEHTNDTLGYYAVGFYHSVGEWNTEVDTIKRFYDNRAPYIRKFMMQEFGITDTSDLNITKVPANGGTVLVDTFAVPASPCRLVYFDGYPVTLKAVPAPGYVFAGWTTSSGDSLPLTWVPNGDTMVTAYFTLLSNEPSTSANSMTKSIANCTKVDLNWTNGNGSSRIVIAHAASAVNVMPVDGCNYPANAAFGNGYNLGNGNYVVYSGNGNSCTVTGLSNGVQYYFAIIEFNGSGAASNYKTTSYPTTNSISPIFSLATQATPVSYCLGGSTILTVHGSNANYTWSPNTALSSTTDSVVTANPTSTITYNVSSYNSNGCLANTDVVVTVNSIPIVTLSNYPDHCIGSGPLTLTGGNPSGGVYSGTGISSGILDPLVTGTGNQNITYTYTDGNGCGAFATAGLYVSSNPTVSLMNDTILCAYGSVLIDAGPGYASYLWSNNLTSQTITVDSNGVGIGIGTYTVTVSNTSNCTATAAVRVTYDICAGIDKPVGNVQSLTVYPNPFRNEILVISNKKDYTITMFDVLGKTVFYQTDNNSTTTIHPEVQTGIYFLRIEDERGAETLKIIRY